MEKDKVAKYVVTASLLGLSIYLKSPIVGVSVVVLFALNYAREILLHTQHIKDVDELAKKIEALSLRIEKQTQKADELNQDLQRVAIRVQETVGGEF